MIISFLKQGLLFNYLPRIEKIIETSDINYGWDGTYKGAKLPVGIYVCKFELTGFHFEEKYYIGHVNLIK